MRNAIGRTFPDTLQNTVRCRPISGCAGLIASKTVGNANQASVSPFFSFPFSFLFFFQWIQCCLCVLSTDCSVQSIVLRSCLIYEFHTHPQPSLQAEMGQDRKFEQTAREQERQ